jgi:hypothetical protein
MAKKGRREDHNENGCDCNGNDCDNDRSNEKDAAMMMNVMTIFGGQ